MARVLSGKSGSAWEWEFIEEDEDVYEPWGSFSRHRAAARPSSDSMAGRLRAALNRAAAAPEVSLQSGFEGAWGRIDEEIQYPFERQEAPRFSFLWDVEAKPVVPGEHWQYLSEFEEF